ncbi:unnamed protein product [Calypogeia fissa]
MAEGRGVLVVGREQELDDGEGELGTEWNAGYGSYSGREVLVAGGDQEVGRNGERRWWREEVVHFSLGNDKGRWNGSLALDQGNGKQWELQERKELDKDGEGGETWVRGTADEIQRKQYGNGEWGKTEALRASGRDA